jgi:hypothetical protein
MGKPEEEYKAKDADIRNYAKYLLNEGSINERKDLLNSFRSKVIIRNKNVFIEV